MRIRLNSETRWKEVSPITGHEALQMIPQVIISGLVLGFMYAIVAIGYTMVYGVLEFINFSHSEIFMVGAVIGTEVFLNLDRFHLLGVLPDWVTLLIGLVVAVLGAGLLGVVVERIAYKPLRNAPRLVPLISAIGVSFFLQDIVRFFETLFRGNYILGVPDLFKGRWNFGSFVTLQYKSVVIIVLALIMLIGLELFVRRSRLGKALRAVAQDMKTAGLMGVPVDSIIMLTFFLGASMGGAAGTLFAVQYSQATPYIGVILGIKAFTAAVFGGIGNLTGAMVGGVLLGVFEAFGGAYLGFLTHNYFGAEYKDIFAFVLLILVLIFKPSGLLGSNVAEKV